MTPDDLKIVKQESEIIMDDAEENAKNKKESVLKTEVSGFDDLFAEKGIPKGNSILVAGGPGTGKSTLCRQICFNLVSKGKKCMYVSFEESKERVIRSMEKFGWNVQKYIDSGDFLIQKLIGLIRLLFFILPLESSEHLSLSGVSH